MGSVRVSLTQKEVASALALAATGTATLDEWADTREIGLRIRVRGRRAVWLLKFRDSSVTLGPAGRWTPRQAREMASHVRGMLKSELDPRPWVDARLAGADAEEAAGVVLRREGRERKEWTVGEVVRQYVDQHLKLGRVVRGERRPPSARSVHDVEASVLRAPAFRMISGLLARELDARRLEDYRNTVAKTNGGSTSRKVLSNVKTAMSWAKKHHGAASGLGGLTALWRDVASTHVEKVRTRMPSVDDLGLTLALGRGRRNDARPQDRQAWVPDACPRPAVHRPYRAAARVGRHDPSRADRNRRTRRRRGLGNPLPTANRDEGPEGAYDPFGPRGYGDRQTSHRDRGRKRVPVPVS